MYMPGHLHTVFSAAGELDGVRLVREYSGMETASTEPGKGEVVQLKVPSAEVMDGSSSTVVTADATLMHAEAVRN